MTKLISFHGKQELKDKYIERLKAHEAADEIIQGVAWENGKGCAVGCTLHSYSHLAYETELGIPRILAKLEDRIFEGQSNEDAKKFPVAFLSAVPVGVDLSNVFKLFFIWMLTDKEDGVINYAKNEDTKKAIQLVSDLISKSLLENVATKEWEAARRTAYAAYADAAADAAYAAAAAAYAAAADAAADAAYAAAAAAYAAAADAAADAAYAAAADAAADAAYAAAAAAAADAAYAADARQKEYKKMSEKLIELLKAAI